MSADSISDCPHCHEGTLREFYGVGLNEAGTDIEVTYRARCPECRFVIPEVTFNQAVSGYVEPIPEWPVQR